MSTGTGTTYIIQEQTQKIDQDTLTDIYIWNLAFMILIIFCRFLYLIVNPRKIKKI